MEVSKAVLDGSWISLGQRKVFLPWQGLKRDELYGFKVLPSRSHAAGVSPECALRMRRVSRALLCPVCSAEMCPAVPVTAAKAAVSAPGFGRSVAALT